MTGSKLLNVDEVVELIGVSRSYAYHVIRKLNEELTAAGAHVLRPLRYVYGVGRGERVHSDAAALIAAAMSASAAPAGMSSSARPTNARIGDAADGSPDAGASSAESAMACPAALAAGTMAFVAAMPCLVTFTHPDVSEFFLPKRRAPPRGRRRATCTCSTCSPCSASTTRRWSFLRPGSALCTGPHVAPCGVSVDRHR